MLFTVAELEQQAVDFDESLVPGSIDFVDDMRQVGVLHTAGRADLLKEWKCEMADLQIRRNLLLSMHRTIEDGVSP